MSDHEHSLTEARAPLPVVERFRKRLGNFLSVEPLEQKGGQSDLYKVETERGTWLLKGHAKPTTAEQILAEQSVLTALIENGLTLAVPFLQGDDGQPYAQYDDRCWTVSRYLDDDPRYDWTRPSWSVETCTSAANGLAQLHHVGYRLLKRSSGIRSEFGSNLINTFTSKFEQAVEQLEKNSGLAAAGLEEFTESTKWLREEVSTTVRQLHELDDRQAPHTVLHGDYHAGNTLFQGERLIGIIDFHYVHLGSPVFDLGYATVMFGTNWLRNELDPQEPSPALPELQAAFVMAYRKAVRQLGADSAWVSAINDSTLLQTYMKLACFLIMHWALEPTDSAEELNTRNRVYVNALDLLRQINLP